MNDLFIVFPTLVRLNTIQAWPKKMYFIALEELGSGLKLDPWQNMEHAFEHVVDKVTRVIILPNCPDSITLSSISISSPLNHADMHLLAKAYAIIYKKKILLFLLIIFLVLS